MIVTERSGSQCSRAETGLRKFWYKDTQPLMAVAQTVTAILTALIFVTQLRAAQHQGEATATASLFSTSIADKQYQTAMANAVRAGAITPDGMNVQGVDGHVVAPLASFTSQGAKAKGGFYPLSQLVDVGLLRTRYYYDQLTGPNSNTWYRYKGSSRKLKDHVHGLPATLQRGPSLSERRLLVERMQQVLLRSGCEIPGRATGAAESQCACMKTLIQTASRWLEEEAKAAKSDTTARKGHEADLKDMKQDGSHEVEAATSNRGISRKMLMPP